MYRDAAFSPRPTYERSLREEKKHIPNEPKVETSVSIKPEQHDISPDTDAASSITMSDQDMSPKGEIADPDIADLSVMDDDLSGESKTVESKVTKDEQIKAESEPPLDNLVLVKDEIKKIESRVKDEADSNDTESKQDEIDANERSQTPEQTLEKSPEQVIDIKKSISPKEEQLDEPDGMVETPKSPIIEKMSKIEQKDQQTKPIDLVKEENIDEELTSVTETTMTKSKSPEQEVKSSLKHDQESHMGSESLKSKPVDKNEDTIKQVKFDEQKIEISSISEQQEPQTEQSIEQESTKETSVESKVDSITESVKEITSTESKERELSTDKQITDETINENEKLISNGDQLSISLDNNSKSDLQSTKDEHTVISTSSVVSENNKDYIESDKTILSKETDKCDETGIKEETSVEDKSKSEKSENEQIKSSSTPIEPTAVNEKVEEKKGIHVDEKTEDDNKKIDKPPVVEEIISKTENTEEHLQPSKTFQSDEAKTITQTSDDIKSSESQKSEKDIDKQQETFLTEEIFSKPELQEQVQTIKSDDVSTGTVMKDKTPEAVPEKLIIESEPTIKETVTEHHETTDSTKTHVTSDEKKEISKEVKEPTEYESKTEHDLQEVSRSTTAESPQNGQIEKQIDQEKSESCDIKTVETGKKQTIDSDKLIKSQIVTSSEITKEEAVVKYDDTTEVQKTEQSERKVETIVKEKSADSSLSDNIVDSDAQSAKSISPTDVSKNKLESASDLGVTNGNDKAIGTNISPLSDTSVSDIKTDKQDSIAKLAAKTQEIKSETVEQNTDKTQEKSSPVIEIQEKSPTANKTQDVSFPVTETGSRSPIEEKTLDMSNSVIETKEKQITTQITHEISSQVIETESKSHTQDKSLETSSSVTETQEKSPTKDKTQETSSSDTKEMSESQIEDKKQETSSSMTEIKETSPTVDKTHEPPSSASKTVSELQTDIKTQEKSSSMTEIKETSPTVDKTQEPSSSDTKTVLELQTEIKTQETSSSMTEIKKTSPTVDKTQETSSLETKTVSVSPTEEKRQETSVSVTEKSPSIDKTLELSSSDTKTVSVSLTEEKTYEISSSVTEKSPSVDKTLKTSSLVTETKALAEDVTDETSSTVFEIESKSQTKDRTQEQSISATDTPSTPQEQGSETESKDRMQETKIITTEQKLESKETKSESPLEKGSSPIKTISTEMTEKSVELESIKSDGKEKSSDSLTETVSLKATETSQLTDTAEQMTHGNLDISLLESTSADIMTIESKQLSAKDSAVSISETFTKDSSVELSKINATEVSKETFSSDTSFQSVSPAQESKSEISTFAVESKTDVDQMKMVSEKEMSTDIKSTVEHSNVGITVEKGSSLEKTAKSSITESKVTQNIEEHEKKISISSSQSTSNDSASAVQKPNTLITETFDKTEDKILETVVQSKVIETSSQEHSFVVESSPTKELPDALPESTGTDPKHVESELSVYDQSATEKVISDDLKIEKPTQIELTDVQKPEDAIEDDKTPEDEINDKLSSTDTDSQTEAKVDTSDKGESETMKNSQSETPLIKTQEQSIDQLTKDSVKSPLSTEDALPAEQTKDKDSGHTNGSKSVSPSKDETINDSNLKSQVPDQDSQKLLPTSEVDLVSKKDKTPEKEDDKIVLESKSPKEESKDKPNGISDISPEKTVTLSNGVTTPDSTKSLTEKVPSPADTEKTADETKVESKPPQKGENEQSTTTKSTDAMTEKIEKLLLNGEDSQVSMKMMRGEVSAKTTYQRTSTGPIAISEVANDGKYIVLENTSSGPKRQDVNLDGWRLRRTVDGTRDYTYNFRNFTLKAGKQVKILARSAASDAGLNDLVFREEDTWGYGSQVKTSLINDKGEEKASHVQKTLYN